ncbi:MAG: NB-ARC domain-containing protein [Polyangiaceae bacterium]
MVPSSFVGRAAERERLATRLRPGAFVSLVGPPGVGKSRLAREVTRERQPVWVSLAEAVAKGDVERAIAAALGWRATDAALDRRRLVRALGQQSQPLIVFDDADRAAEHILAWLPELMTELPTLSVLATARRALGLLGEERLYLEGLDLEQARALFLARAEAVASPAVVCAATADPALDTLLARLDGLPLGIELAAARADTRLPTELLDDLDRRFDVLAPQPPEVLPSLWDVIDRSWASLAPAHRRSLSLLALVESPLPRDAIHALVGASPESVDPTLDELVRRSLVVAEPGVGRLHHRLLDSIRDFARLKAAEESAADLRLDLSRARARYVTWARTRAASLLQALERDLGPACDELVAFRPHLEEALTFVPEGSPDALALLRALDRVLERTGPAAHHQHLVERHLAQTPPESLEAVELLTALSRIHQLAQRHRTARDVLTRALALCLELGEPERAVPLRYYVARTQVQIMDDPEQVRQAAAEARDAARTHGLPVYEAGAISTAAMVAHFEGDLAQSLALHQQAAGILPHDDATRVGPVMHMHHALARLAGGEIATARALMDETLAGLQARRDELLLSKLSPLLARLALAEGDTTAAEHHLARARADAERLADRGLEIELAIEQARLHAHRGDHARASAELTRARARAGPRMTPRLARYLQEATPPTQHATLRITPTGDGFRRDDAAPVDLRRRLAPRRILAALLAADAPLDVAALAQAGWPKQQMHPESAAKRVWTAVWTLRKAGLEGVLEHHHGGYILRAPNLERVPFDEL